MSLSIPLRLTLVACSAVYLSLPMRAGAEIGHFVGGVANIRDYVVPSEPGVYAVAYNYFYYTQRINDRNGNKIDSVTVGPPPGVTLGLDVDVELYAVLPALIWVSEWKLLGARYGAFISPSFADASIGAALSTANGRAINAQVGDFGVGDLFVQPVWLGWSPKHFDFALAYGFWAPVGRYDTEVVTFPPVGSLRVEEADNLGLGFWTHQIQAAGTWYPFDHPGTAVATALTYEIHGDKEDFDLKPGQNLTLNWGVSQYLPLAKDQSLLLEIGPAGYSSWQVTDDDGSDSRNNVQDSVHAAGVQLGITYVPWNVVLNLHYFAEFASEDRFEGDSWGFSAAMKF